MNRGVVLAALIGLATLAGLAAPGAAKVVNENTDELPPGCDAVAGDVTFTVHGGREHARGFNGAAFTFDNRSWDLPACTRVTVTFVNDDHIRHQFMVHGAWPHGFFQIEVDGPGQDTGTFILGSKQSTLLVHCGVPQHQQKGMKAEFLIDGGLGHLPNIPGISGIPAGPAHGGNVVEQPEGAPAPSLGAFAALVAIVGSAVLVRRSRR